MQNRRAPEASPDRSKRVRTNGSQVILWRPEIVLAPGTVLASLEDARHTAGARPAVETPRMNVSLEAGRLEPARRSVLPAGLRASTGLIPQGGWR